MEYSIEDFCKNPNNITISKLSPEVLEIIYNASKKVMILKEKEPENKKVTKNKKNGGLELNIS